MKMIQSGSKKFVSIVATLFVVLFGIMANGCGGGGGGGGDVVLPGVPEKFRVVPNIGGQDLSATLTWDIPTTGSEPTSYEIYRGTTPGSVFDPDNHLRSIPVEEGETSYVYIDNVGLVKDVNTSYVVAAKNANGETPTSEESIIFTTGEVESYGNNFAAAMIFADGYGITGLPLDPTKPWMELYTSLDQIDYGTGLRPSSDQNQTLTEVPFFDDTITFEKGGVTYYPQQTVSTWQGEWKDGNDADQHVTATFGDNLISQTLTSESKIRIEVALTKDLDGIQDENMTSYNMVSLYGSKYNEIYGTNMETYENNTSFVFATNAHLKIQKVDAQGVPQADPLYDQPLFSCEGGPGCFSSEVNVAGNFIYGFVWDLANDNPGYEKTGIWRITFSLDETSVPTGAQNHTFIDDVAPTEAESEGGTLPQYVDVNEVYIDITIH